MPPPNTVNGLGLGSPCPAAGPVAVGTLTPAAPLGVGGLVKKESGVEPPEAEDVPPIAPIPPPNMLEPEITGYVRVKEG